MVLPNATLFPRTMLPLYIFEPWYRKMLSRSLKGNRMFAVAMKKADCSREIPSRVAGLGIVRVAVRNDDGTYHLVLQGLSRIELGKALSYRPFRRHRFSVIEAQSRETEDVRSLMQQIVQLIQIRLSQGYKVSVEILKDIATAKTPALEKMVGQSVDEALAKMAQVADPEQLIDLVSCTFLTIPRERQTMLEVIDIEARLNSLISFLSAEVARNA
ncbi:MAG: Lon protease [Verrucomicrobia subdivision 3 bacterium]|nr:Lon protease [Limisphaerales bacterium]MCS1414409.1 Lon protease [Limisphaerales bacterium]